MQWSVALSSAFYRDGRTRQIEDCLALSLFGSVAVFVGCDILWYLYVAVYLAVIVGCDVLSYLYVDGKPFFFTLIQ